MKFKIITTSEFTRANVIANKNAIFLFTDNLKRTSGKNMLNQSIDYVQRWRSRMIDMPLNHYFPTMTQAVIRGLDNAFPITTMKDNRCTQLTIDDLDYMRWVWKTEVQDIIDYAKLHDIDTIVCSNQTFGKGRYSNLYECEPLFKALSNELYRINISNDLSGVRQLED